MTRQAYRAHSGLVVAARARPELWRLLVGLVLAAAVILALNMALQIGLSTLLPGFWQTQFAGGQGATPAAMLVLLGSFGFVFVAVATAARVMQGRDFWGIIGPVPLALAQFWQVMRLLLVLAAILLVLPPYDMGPTLVQNLALSTWLMLLPLSLLGVLIQTSSEEVLFRGYIQQQLAARFSSPLIWGVLPSVLFAVGHYLPVQAGANAGLIALWAGVFGVLMADLTARAGTLGPAIAVHMANNVWALLAVSLPDQLHGLSLYTVPFDMADTTQLRAWLPVDFALMLVSWLAARLAIRR